MKNTSAIKISLAAIAALGSVTGFIRDAHAAVVINEIYGGGGFSAGTGTSTAPASVYNRDFVELYNNGSAAVDISGYAIRYGSAASTTMTPTLPGSSGWTIATGVSIPAGGFYLLGGTTTTSSVGLAFTSDLTAGVDLSATSGRVGLYASASAAAALDFAGYGSATAYENTAAAAFGGTAPGGTFSLNRTLGLDTNNNATDFTFAAPTPTGVPEPTALGLAAAGGALLVGRRRNQR